MHLNPERGVLEGGFRKHRQALKAQDGAGDGDRPRDCRETVFSIIPRTLASSRSLFVRVRAPRRARRAESSEGCVDDDDFFGVFFVLTSGGKFVRAQHRAKYHMLCMCMYVCAN